jgi:hypothetical protein
VTIGTRRITRHLGSLPVGMANITLSFTPNELVSIGSTLTIGGAPGVDAQAAQGAVRVFGAEGSVAVLVATDPDAGTVAVPTEHLAPGAYVLSVDGLLDTKGTALGSTTAPFTITSFTGKIDERLRVEHVVRLAVGELDTERLGPNDLVPLGTDYLEVVKAVDRESGAAVDLAFDAKGTPVDADEIFRSVGARRYDKYGKLHQTLYRHLEDLGPDDMVDVVVWPVIDRDVFAYEKPSKGEITTVPDAQLKADAVVRDRLQAAHDALRRVEATIRSDKADDVPCVYATVTVTALRELAGNDAVGLVLLDDHSEVLDLGTSVSIAHTDQVHNLGFNGTGVRVAVFESGPSDTTNLTFAGRFTTTPAASGHARLTSAVIRNSEPNAPHGHAPGCQLFSANTGGNDALQWAVDQGCTVISQSFHRKTEPGGADLQTDDVLKDWLALRFPFPTIVQAAGNFWSTDPDGISPPASEFVNHKGFNTLSIGNHDDTAGAMSGSSVFRNPSSSHGDRELPELCANGTSVSAVGESMSGTSFSAPAVAGVTAVLQGVDATLRSWPEGCRAILMASATRNVANGTWWGDVSAHRDASDGAGAVDAAAGVRVAQQRRWRNSAGVQRGWDVGTLASDDFGGDRLATFRYRVTVPRRAVLPKVKVALAWDSSVSSIVGIPLSSTLSVDLDLIVRNSAGVQVASSASFDNSYEIAEFAAGAGETYEIVIRRWSGTDSVWFGVAWNTQSGLLFPSPMSAVTSASAASRR